MELTKHGKRILENILCDIIYEKIETNEETWRLALDLNSYISRIPDEHGIFIEDAEKWIL